MKNVIYRYKIVPIALLLWVIPLISWVTFRVFGPNSPNITIGTASAFGALLGIPGIIIGLWRWRNNNSKNTIDVKSSIDLVE